MQALKTRSFTLNRPAGVPAASAARLLLGGVVLLAAAAMVQPAWARPGDGMREGGPHAMHHHGSGPGPHMMEPGGMFGGPGMLMMHGRGLHRMLDSIKATPEQRTQIEQIMDAARSDLKAQSEAGRSLRDQGRALFAQPNIDARQAEALRQQMLAQHDQASKRKLQAMLDVQRVLTPEQRQQIAERMAQRQQMMERHRSEREAMRPGR